MQKENKQAAQQIINCTNGSAKEVYSSSSNHPYLGWQGSTRKKRSIKGGFTRIFRKSYKGINSTSWLCTKNKAMPTKEMQSVNSSKETKLSMKDYVGARNATIVYFTLSER